MTADACLVRVASCDVGLGLFAAQPIAVGQRILTFEGPLLTLPEVRAKGPQAANALQIGVNRYLDLAEPGRLVNHSCAPNAGIRDDIHLTALRPIEIGEEIRFDYSTTIGDRWTMACACGAPECRGVVASYAALPPERRADYAALGIVQRFLLDAGGHQVAIP